MTAVERTLTSSDGTRIWAEAMANPSRPAVVFIHGLACPTMLFDKQFHDPEMLESLYMVRYEMRGHGRSDTPQSIEGYNSALQAADFRVVCEAFDLAKPWVLGWSLGATIVVDIANHLSSDYISGVIYCGGAVLSLKLGIENIPASFMPLMPVIQSTVASTVAQSAPRFVEGCIAHPEDVAILPWSVKLQWMGAFATQPPEVRAWVHKREQDERRWREEARSLPVILIQGRDDTHCDSDSLAEQVKELYESVEVHLLEGVGHAPHWEQPDVVNGLVLAFLQKHNVI